MTIMSMMVTMSMIMITVSKGSLCGGGLWEGPRRGSLESEKNNIVIHILNEKGGSWWVQRAVFTCPGRPAGYLTCLPLAGTRFFSRVQAAQGKSLGWRSRAATTCFHVSWPPRGYLTW